MNVLPVACLKKREKLTVDRAIRNFLSVAGCSEVEAVAASTANPARVLRDSKRGKLEVGARADVTVVDSDFNVKVTLVGGDVAFVAPDAIVKKHNEARS